MKFQPTHYAMTAGVVCLVFLGLIFQFSGDIDLLQEKIQKDKQLLAWMSEAGADIHRLKQSTRAPSSSSLLSLLDHESKAGVWNKYSMNMKQDENDQVEISFSRIAFDDLMTGLEQLFAKNGVEVAKFNLQPIENSNIVSASILLQNR